MRLRRETGDFQIKVTSGTVNTIRKGLSAEDFVGELVNVDGTYEAVINANESEGIVTFKSASYTLTYNKSTGALTASEGGAGGSGSGGSGLVVEGTYEYDEGLEYNIFKVAEPIATGLTEEDFLGAIFDITYTHNDKEDRARFPVSGVSTTNANDTANLPEGCLVVHTATINTRTSYEEVAEQILYYDPATGIITANTNDFGRSNS